MSRKYYLFTTLIFSCTTTAFADDTYGTYGTLKNQADKNSSCLAAAANGTPVFSPCNGSKDQNWRFSAGGFIQNEFHGDQKCLRTASDGRTVTIGACGGDGFTSMRIWRIGRNPDNTITPRNKYNQDNGKSETLNSNASFSRVAMSIATNQSLAKWIFSGRIPDPARPTIGKKTVLLMATHYNGATPAAPDPIRKAVFGDGDDYQSLAHYLKLSSHGRLTIQGDFLTNINLGNRPASCSTPNILDKARKAARENGVEPDNYDYLFVDISRSNCNWSGISNAPANWVISNGTGHKYWMWSHEFGHAIGYEHTKTLRNCPMQNGIVQLDGGCKTGAGDDPTDTLGGGGGRLYPVNYQHFSTWLGDADVPTIEKSGTYTLGPLWQTGGTPGYKIRRTDGSYLFLEFRQPQAGFDDWPSNSPFVNGVIVRIANYSVPSMTNQLVDTTPTSKQGMKDAPLMPGRSLFDTRSNKKITVVSVSPTGAVIEIEDGTSVE